MIATMKVSEYIGMVQGRLGYTSNKDSIFFKQQVFLALNEACFHLMNTQTKVFKTDRESLCIDKPEDFVAVKKITLKRDKCCVEPIYDSSFICCQSHSDCCPDFTVQCLKDKIQYSSNIPECFDCIILEYYAMCLDEDGSPLIPFMAMPYLDAYLDWAMLKMVRRANMSKSASRQNPVNQSEVSEAYSKYKNELRSLFASMVTPTAQQLGQIGEMWVYTPSLFPPAIQSCVKRFY